MANERVILYYRVSSEKQATEAKTGWATQEAQCRKAVAERGYEIVGTYKDIIPRNILQRPGLDAARARIAAGEADILMASVMASVMDRLTNSDPHLYILDEELGKKTARLEFALEEYDTTPMGALIRSIRTFMAAVEQEKLSFRTQQGIDIKIAKGEAMGTIPLGFKKEDGKVIVNPLTAPTIRRIFELYATEHLSLRKLAKVLKAEGHITGQGKPNWSPSALNRIIENPKYMGKWQGGQWRQVREKGKKAKPVLKPEAEWGPVFEGPAIITEELFHKANRIRTSARAESPRRSGTPENFLLKATHIRCGLCKGPMHGVTPGKSQRERAPYYVCDSRKLSQPGCKGVYISTRKIDPWTWDVCRQVLDDPDVLVEWGFAQAEDGSLDEAIARAKAELKAVQDEFDRLSDRLAKVPDAFVDGIITKLGGLEIRQQTAQKELEELQAQAAKQGKLAELKGTLETWQADVRARLDTLTYKEKLDIIRDLKIMVEVYPEDRVPRWTLGMNTEALWFGPQYSEPDWYSSTGPELPQEGPFYDSDSVAKPCALLSATPRASMRPSRISGSNGSDFQRLSGSAG